MKKIILATLVLLFTFACKNDFNEENYADFTENAIINDSIQKIKVSKLPDNVKEAFDKVLISQHITSRGNGAQNQEKRFEFLENEVIVISQATGITNYSIQVKQNVDIEAFLKNKDIAKLFSKPSKDCQSIGLGADQASNSIQMVTINISADGTQGEPTLATYNNYGNFIESNFTNLTNGDRFGTWVPNPASGGIGGVDGSSSTEGGDSYGNYDGYGEWKFYDFLRDSWGRIVSFKNQIYRYIRNLFCGCSYKRPTEPTSAHPDLGLFINCDCNKNNYALDNDFSTLLPESFFEYDKNSFKNKDCECLYEEQKKNNDTTDNNLPASQTLEGHIYLDCSCQKNEAGGVALFLNLSASEKEFLAQNLHFNAEICTFLSKDRTQAAVEFAKEAVKVKMQGGEVDFPNRLILDWSFVQNNKLRCIGYKFYLTKNNQISQYLKNFLKDGPKGFLKLSAVSNFGQRFKTSERTTAVTIPPKNNIIEIVFNTDPNADGNIMNTSTILVGFALIHEMVHAEIFRKLLDVSDLPYIPKKHSPEWESFMNNLYEGFYEYFDIYVRLSFKTTNPTELQHELMAQNYIETMVRALTDFDKNKHPKEFYEDIAWIGLQNTIAFKNRFIPDLKALNRFNNSLNQAKNETKNCTN